MPAAVAARPSDSRGYPVPAITPWACGQPQFAALSAERTYLCATERRCSICGLGMPEGPVWRVVGGREAEAIQAAIDGGRAYVNAAPTTEAPGHRACMIFAAITCPYLAMPTARRSRDASAAGQNARRGDRRTPGGAIAAFALVEHCLAGTVLFRFTGLREFLPYHRGSDLLTELSRTLRAEPGADAGPPVPGYLLDDEEAVAGRVAHHLSTTANPQE